MFEKISINKQGKESNYIPIVTDLEGIEESDEIFPDELDILPLRNTVLFPGVVIPISIGRKKSLSLIKTAFEKDKIIGIASQKDSSVENPGFEDLYKIGTLAKILRIFDMPDGNKTAIIQGKKRFEITEDVSTKSNFKVKYNILQDVKPADGDVNFEALISSIKDYSVKIIELSVNIPKEAIFAIKNINNSTFLINFVSSNSDMNASDKQKILEENNLTERGNILLLYLSNEVKKLELKGEIINKAKTEIDQQQKEYYLHQQMKAIQEELGFETPKIEIEELEKNSKNKKWDENVEKLFRKQLNRLKQINPMAPDYSYQLAYLQTLVDLPWNEYTNDNFDLKRAQNILDADHFGLEKVKERIIEHLAVLKLKGDLKAPILCLYGPPGVGKTSLGKSVAKALDRKYARMSLGGLHDEAEIRGHRKTYIGAMPGRIIQNLKKVKSSNPVFILDEIDKVGNDFRGDPSSALLEVLDPEQNNSFYDNYLETEFDLSKILFIATANNLSSINSALRDRMELIDVSGYIVEEKIEIAERHLIPKQLAEHGVTKEQLIFSKQSLEEIINNYTRESGVRALEKKIAEIVRKIAKSIAMEENYDKKISKEIVTNYLGVSKYQKEEYEGNEYAGVTTGLAWTAVGGTILFVEASLSKGSGNLNLTGNLGAVMKESVIIALEFIKSHAEELGIETRILTNYNIHVHIPEGAVPKDGPSAGITMITSIVSALTQRKVKKNLAMTGEITLRGKVLPVGGIKEKILAAKRSGIKEIILSEDNRKDISEIKEIYVKGLVFHFVKTIQEVVEIAVLKQKIKNPQKFTFKK
jgi:ATP-dependent Lon protease